MNCPPWLSAIGSFGGFAFLGWYLIARISNARAYARSRRIDAEHPAPPVPPPQMWHRYRCEDCGQIVALMGIDGKGCPMTATARSDP